MRDGFLRFIAQPDFTVMSCGCYINAWLVATRSSVVKKVNYQTNYTMNKFVNLVANELQI